MLLSELSGRTPGTVRTDDTPAKAGTSPSAHPSPSGPHQTALTLVKHFYPPTLPPKNRPRPSLFLSILSLEIRR